MQIQLIRNATLKIHYAGKVILLDPMFSPKESFDSFAGISRNPTVDLPLSIEEITAGVDLLLISHTHPDHLDPVAIASLDKSLPLFCQPVDESTIREYGFTQTQAIQTQASWEGITITRTGGQHGRGEVLKMMGEVSGFVLQAEGEPSVYIVGDSVWVDEVKNAINQFQPEVVVTNSGGAVFPPYEDTPILMNEAETIQVAQAIPSATIIAVHLESLDHCRVTRATLAEQAAAAGLSLVIPADGEVVEL